MGEKKLKISKGWLNEGTDEGNAAGSRSRTELKIEVQQVTKTEDLPELLTGKDAARILRCGYKHVEELRRDKQLEFMKRDGRYFTTPEWIGDYLVRKMKA